LRLFENRVLRRIFIRKREEVEGGWRRLNNEELHNLYVPPSINRVINSRRMRRFGQVACMGEMTNAYKVLITKHEGRRPPRRWKNNTRIELTKIGC
jgi:hypothetical protein